MRTLLYKNALGDAIGDDNPLPTETRGYSFSNIKTATTTAVKATPGFLHSVVINTAKANGKIEVFNNTSAAGATVATITMPATLLSDSPHLALFDVECSVGITVKTTGTMDITVSYL